MQFISLCFLQFPFHYVSHLDLSELYLVTVTRLFTDLFCASCNGHCNKCLLCFSVITCVLLESTQTKLYDTPPQINIELQIAFLAGLQYTERSGKASPLWLPCLSLCTEARGTVACTITVLLCRRVPLQSPPVWCGVHRRARSLCSPRGH